MPTLTPEKQQEVPPAPIAEEAPFEDRSGRQAFALFGGAAVIVALAIVALVIALNSGGTTKKASTPASAPAAAPAATATPVVTPAARISVSLREFTVTPSATVGKAGRITFKVSNAGQITHEFVVLRTTHPAAALPLKGGRADEAGNVGETGDLAAGQTKTVALKLKAGHYALICNLPGHYKAGQRVDFTVK